MTTDIERYRNLAGLGASHTALAWVAYALVECWLLAFLPWFSRPAHEFVPLHPGFTAFLLVLYPLIGAFLGSVAGSVLAGLSWRGRASTDETNSVFLSSFAVLTVVLAFLLNFTINLWGQIGRSELPILTISLLLLVALLLSSISIVWHRRLRAFTNPWAVSFLLLGVRGLGGALFGPSGALWKATGMLVFTAGVVLLSLVILRLRAVFTGDNVLSASSVPTRRYGVTLTAVVVLTVGLSMIPRQAVFVQDGVTADDIPAGDHANVILIVMDTVRADHLSIDGYERDTTPRLRELAAEATNYRNVMAPADMTLPSHASLFTGLYASRHRAHLDPAAGYGMGRPLSEELSTLAENLAGAGYDTLAVVSNHGYVTSSFGLAQGFRYFDQRSPVLPLAAKGPIYIREGVRNLAVKIFPAAGFGWYRSAEAINHEVFRLLDSMEDHRRPFFLFINYMDAHWPYVPPPPYEDLYPGRDPSFNVPRYSEMAEQVMGLEREVTSSEREHLVSQYDGEIAYLDHHIGALVAELKRREMYDNTLLIVTSDHGEAMGERNLVGHMVSVYQDQVYVHLLVKYPDQTAPSVVHEAASLVDVMPTVLDVVGLDLPSSLDGRSLVGPESREPRYLISESFPSSYLLSLHSRFDRIERAVLFNNQKLVTSTAGRRETYDLRVDPHERTNLHARDGQIANELEEHLRHWLLQVAVPDSGPGELDEGTLERLRSLGYIQ
jgi:arylsulfatase A-like enzyme